LNERLATDLGRGQNEASMESEVKAKVIPRALARWLEFARALPLGIGQLAVWFLMVPDQSGQLYLSGQQRFRIVLPSRALSWSEVSQPLAIHLSGTGAEQLVRAGPIHGSFWALAGGLIR
jgi:hypothetical protein